MTKRINRESFPLLALTRVCETWVLEAQERGAPECVDPLQAARDWFQTNIRDEDPRVSTIDVAGFAAVLESTGAAGALARLDELARPKRASRKRAPELVDA